MVSEQQLTGLMDGLNSDRSQKFINHIVIDFFERPAFGRVFLFIILHLH